jgi:hypothetical protein
MERHKRGPLRSESSTAGSAALFVDNCYDRGSATYRLRQKIFRLVDGIVYASDEITIESALAMCASVVNQWVDTEIRQTSADRLVIDLRYDFFPNSCAQDSILTGRCAIKVEESGPIAALSRRVRITYLWSDSTHRFEPQFEGTGLTPEKLECTSRLGIDDIFQSAFADELKAVAASGDECRAALAKYLLSYAPPPREND